MPRHAQPTSIEQMFIGGVIPRDAVGRVLEQYFLNGATHLDISPGPMNGKSRKSDTNGQKALTEVQQKLLPPPTKNGKQRKRGEKGKLMDGQAVRPGTDREKVLNYIIANGPIKTASLSDHFKDMPYGSLTGHIKKLQDRGAVKSVSTGVWAGA